MQADENLFKEKCLYHGDVEKLLKEKEVEKRRLFKSVLKNSKNAMLLK